MADPKWPTADPERPVLFLIEAHSRFERRRIEAWIESSRPGAGADRPPERPDAPEPPDTVTVIQLPATRRRSGRLRLDPALADALTRFDDAGTDAIAAPLRVLWKSPKRAAGKRSGLLELLIAGDPRDPGWLRQLWVAYRSPERCLVIAGEPAPISDLHARWVDSSSAPSSAADDFARFVAQKATLALERAERHVRGARYKVPRLIHDEILTRRDFQKSLLTLQPEIAAEEKTTPDELGLAELTERAARILREIAASHNPFIIDLFTQAIRKIYTRGYSEELVYETAAMRRIAALQERYPVVFLPSHKSQLDHLVLQYALHEQGLPPNHTAGGINMNFFPVGPFLRRSGVFFIRRSFKNATLYRFVLSSYMDYLIEKRFPLEWYIEGGRSRSGKLRPPQYGLLASVFDAFQREKSDDIYFVPVAIAYDQIQDVGDYAAEQRGAAKQKEGFSWMVRALHQLKRRYGKIHIAFGEPISLRAELAGPSLSEDPPEARTFALQKLAFEVCVRINRVTPITPTSLVTLTLLGTAGQALTVTETRKSLANLLELVRLRELPTTAEFDHLETDQGVEFALEALVENDIVKRFDGGLERVYGIGKNQQLAAAYYRNTIVHFFVAAAISELALLHCLDHPRSETLPRFWDEVMRLRDLLKFEFFFSRKADFREEIRAELSLRSRNWEKRLADYEIGPDDLLRRAKPLCAHRILRPFFESYRVAADQLASLPPEEAFDEKRFFADCLGLGRQYELQRRIQGADSVSKSLFETALKLARNRGLVDSAQTSEATHTTDTTDTTHTAHTSESAEDIAEKRRAFADEIRDAVRRVDIVVALAASRRAGYEN